jgi:DNA-binding CsgD family transcriptional regulator
MNPTSPCPTARDAFREELIKLIYQGPMETQPWQSFVTRLRAVVDAMALTVVLYPSDDQHTEIHVIASAPGKDIDWDTLNWHYIRDYMAMDPTAPDKTAPGQLLNIENFKDSTYYREFLQPNGVEHAIRMGFSEPGGMHCWLAAAKSREDGPFTAADTGLLQYLLPHLEQALMLYANIMLSQSEKSLYREAIEHLSFGSILLDGDRKIISANQIAIGIAAKHAEINIDDDTLTLADRDANASFQQALDAAIASRTAAATGRQLELARVECAGGNVIGLLIRPTPRMPYYHGRHTPNVIIYVSDLEQHIESWNQPQSEPQQLIAKLFKLTQTEAKLALLLADGRTLAEAAVAMNITEKTARNHSKNIYEKTSIKRQVDLVRLIYKSVALLG